jgi:hypothetical protein
MDMKDLVRAIKKHSGMDNEQIAEAGEQGAEGGYPGFSYYRDTADFYDENAELIWELLNDEADDLGEKHALAMIANFREARSVVDDDSFKNLMSFFALEEAGRWLGEQRDFEKEEESN